MKVGDLCVYGDPLILGDPQRLHRFCQNLHVAILGISEAA